MDPSGRVFLGAAGGGVWTSTNAGANWTAIGDSLPTQAIGAIAIDPRTTPTTLFVATGENNSSLDSYYGQGIYKSTDLGTNWTQITPASFDHVSVSRLAIDTSQTPAHLFAATGSGFSAGRADPPISPTDSTATGLWRSFDDGATWMHYPSTAFVVAVPPGAPTQLQAAAVNFYDVAIDSANPTEIYATQGSAGVFHSRDGGLTWSYACFTNDNPCSFASTPTFRQSVSIGPAALGAPKNCSGNTRACGTVYAMASDGSGSVYTGFFRSVDGGTTWTAGSVPSWTDPKTKKTIDGTSPTNYGNSFYTNVLLADPFNPPMLFFGGVAPYVSDDGGNTWSFLAADGGTHADQHAFAIASDGGTVYLGNDGGAYKFSIGAISGGTAVFTALNDTLPVGQIQGIGPHPTSNSSLLAGFQDNGTTLYSGTSSNPLAWPMVETGDGGFALFDQVNPSFAYHTFASVPGTGPCADITIGVLSTSSDGGQTWDNEDPTGAICAAMGAAKDTGANFYPPLAGDPKIAQRVLFGAEHIYVSIDGMKSWALETTQDLSSGCGSGDCALQDIEFAPSDNTKAWALSISQVRRVGFKLWNTTEAQCPDQPNCPSGPTSVSWSDLTGNLPFASIGTQATGIAPNPNNSADAYLSISGFTESTGIGHIFRSKDSGATWMEADGASTNAGNSSCSSFAALPDIPVLRVLADKADATGNTIYAATDIGVFESVDGGCHWAAFNLGVIPAVPVFDIEQSLGGGAIFIGTHGRGAYQLVP